jgi:endoglucanase
LKNEIFATVDKLVARAQKHKLAMIINIHHFDDFTTDPAKYRDKFAALWNQIAAHYAKSPETVFFELLNEPKDAMTTTVLNPIYADVLRQIRRTNPKRTILVGPGLWNSVAELVNLKLPDDDQNLIVTVHNYDPFQFTHQGASWGGPDVKVKGIRFPGPPAKPLILDSALALSPHVHDWIARYNSNQGDSNPCSEATLREIVIHAKDWSDYYGRPIHFGEFGVYIEADPESRANYVRTFRQAFDEADLGWALWDWKAAFRYWDTDHNRPSAGFREALLPKR